MLKSLIPERHILLSASLATTIGLEEAVMLQVLHDIATHRTATVSNGYRWFDLDSTTVSEFLPFWEAPDIQRIAMSLRENGILLIRSAPYASSGVLSCAFNEPAADTLETKSRSEANTPVAQPAPVVKTVATAPATTVPAQPAPYSGSWQTGANLISRTWRPDREVIRQLAMFGIPEVFIDECLPEFVTYWHERGEAHHSWGSKFQKKVRDEWKKQQNTQRTLERKVAMTREWWPSVDALELLEKGGIPRDFSADTVAEFVLKWQERGEASDQWNMRLVEHVRLQWARAQGTLRGDGVPRQIAANWQPSDDVYDILCNMANIERQFVRECVPEFVLFWRESGDAYRSWNARFVQRVKHQWARRHQIQAGPHGNFIEKHTDNSWADGV